MLPARLDRREDTVSEPSWQRASRGPAGRHLKSLGGGGPRSRPQHPRAGSDGRQDSPTDLMRDSSSRRVACGAGVDEKARAADGAALTARTAVREVERSMAGCVRVLCGPACGSCDPDQEQWGAREGGDPLSLRQLTGQHAVSLTTHRWNCMLLHEAYSMLSVSARSIAMPTGPRRRSTARCPRIPSVSSSGRAASRNG